MSDEKHTPENEEVSYYVGDPPSAAEDTTINAVSGSSPNLFPKKSKGKYVPDEAPQAQPLPPQAWRDTTQVSIVGDARDGKYLVVTDAGEWYIVPMDVLHWTVKPQAINNVALQNGERPYDWQSEIESLSATPDDVRKALWREGMIAKDDAEGDTLKKLLKALFTQGVLPVNKE